MSIFWMAPTIMHASMKSNINVSIAFLEVTL